MIKFGKKEARPGSVSLKFGDVFNLPAMPHPPIAFGHYNLMPNGDYFMLSNDQWGDCVWAGAAHEHMLWTLESGSPRAHFTSKDVLSDYSAATGFDPMKPESDQGTDMQQAAAYRQKIGIIDTSGNRHKIDAYAALKLGDTNQLAQAAWLFGAVGVGVNVPSSMIEQFQTNQVWSIASGDTIRGAHYIPCVGRDSRGNFVFISWGRVHTATPDWVSEYMDEAIAYLALESINASTKVTPENFNPAALTQYLKEF